MAETSLARDLDGLRRSCGLSYRDLARRTGCPRSTLNDALSGRRFPRLSTVLAIVRACAAAGTADEAHWRQRWAAADRARGYEGGNGEPGHRVPAELPHATAGFVGRAAELDRLDALLDAAPADPAALLVVSIDGAAGVGKTALAVRWGRRVAHRFPGGQLFVNLRGHHPRLRPLRPGQALEQLLRALGATRVPANSEERARAFRSALAGRRVLVVLDDAATAGQVRPLLPGDPGCAVVVTSRERLDGLTALDGARRIGLDVLGSAEARDVLARALGERRVGREPAAAAELAALCANLPLALRIAAAHLAAHTDRPIGALVAELAADDRLGALRLPDGDACVRAAFELSYHRLPVPARRLFRRLGLVPGPDLSLGAATALDPQAPSSMDVLAAAHMVEEHSPGRYQLHDLLRCYATQLCGQDGDPHDGDPDDGEGAARRRLFGWYLEKAEQACHVLNPNILRLTEQLPGALFADDVEAMSWLDAERDNLVAVIAHAAEHGPRPLAWQLADALRGYFQLRQHRHSWQAAVAAGQAAAEREGDAAARGAMQHNLGVMHWRTGNQAAAVRALTRAHDAYHEAGWADGRAAVLNSLGAVYWQLGRPLDCANFNERAIGVCRRHGLTSREAVCLASLGMAYHDLGLLRSALELLHRALERHRELGETRRIAVVTTTIGDVRHDLGEHEPALASHRQARAIFAAIGSLDGEAHALRGVAAAIGELGRHREALALAEQALGLAAESANSTVLADTRNTLGDAHRRLGLLDDAGHHHEQALQRASQAGYLAGAGAALVGLAAVRLEQRDTARALDHCQQALRLTGRGRHPLLRARAFQVLTRARAPAPAGGELVQA